MVKKISNSSDIEIEVVFKDRDCKVQPVPDHSFEFEWYTNYSAKVISASYNADTGEYVNCEVRDGRLVCFFEEPRLGNGRIKSRKIFHIPDYEDPTKDQEAVFENNTDFWIGEDDPWAKTRILVVEDPVTCYGNVVIPSTPVVMDYAPIFWYYQYVMLSDGQILGTSDEEAFMVEIK